MKLSDFKWSLLGLAILMVMRGPAWAQKGLDNILPPDHMLEMIHWMEDDGNIVDKAIILYEPLRGLKYSNGKDIQDLIVLYRQSAPVSELDKPHNQTLNVCFYDSNHNSYVNALQEDGGIVRWIKLLNVPEKKAPALIYLRDDLNGNQILKGFIYEDGKMKQVMDAEAPRVFVRFESGILWCSSKEYPKDQSEAEHVVAWNGPKDLFAEAKPASGGLAGWSGTSIAVPEKPVETQPVTVASAATPPAKPKHPSLKGWWDEPMDAQASLAKLDTELVPSLLKKGQIVALGQKASAFFKELQKEKVPMKEINGMRSNYYAAVASTLLDMGNKKDAAYYLKIALSFQPDNADALAVKEKLK